MIKRLADNEWTNTRWKTFEEIEARFSRTQRCTLQGETYLIVVTHDEWGETISVYYQYGRK